MRFPARLLQRIYKLTVSPFLHWIAGPGAGCRFEPSCSACTSWKRWKRMAFSAGRALEFTVSAAAIRGAQEASIRFRRRESRRESEAENYGP